MIKKTYKKLLLVVVSWCMAALSEPITEPMVRDIINETLHKKMEVGAFPLVRLLMAYISQCDDGEDENGDKQEGYVPYWTKKNRSFDKVVKHYRTWLVYEGLLDREDKEADKCLVHALSLMRTALK